MEAPHTLTIPLGLELRHEPLTMGDSTLMVPTDGRTVTMMGGGLTNEMAPIPLFDDMLRSVSDTVARSKTARRGKVYTMRKRR